MAIETLPTDHSIDQYGKRYPENVQRYEEYFSLENVGTIEINITQQGHILRDEKKGKVFI